MRTVMRRELDNCVELLELMASCESKLIHTASLKEDENTFLFGPDLRDQLRKKVSLMVECWHDAYRLFFNREDFNINM